MRETIDLNASRTFDLLVEHETEVLLQRMGEYERMLLGASGLIKASNAVSRDEWRIYHEALFLERTLPGVQALGYAIIFPAEKKNEIELSIKGEGFEEFSIYPDGDRDVYSAIVYIEPFSDRNLRAFGYDMYSEAVRNKAMDRAIKTGLPAWTGKVTLVQENGNGVQSGFLVYLPFYKKGKSIRNEIERSEAIEGFVYSAFRATDMMERLYNEQKREFEIKIYDNEVTDENLIYQSSLAPIDSDFYKVVKVTIGGAQWQAVFYGNEGFARTQDYSIANLFLGSGLTLLLISAVAIIRDRRNSLQLKIANSNLEKSAGDAKAMVELTELLQNCNGLDEAYVILTEGLEKLFTNTSGACYLLSENGDSLLRKSFWGQEHLTSTEFSIDSCWAIKRSSLHISSQDNFPNVRCSHLSTKNEFSTCSPLLSHGKLIGVVCLIPNKREDIPSSSKISSVSEVISLALANLKLGISLKELAIRDPLTGLYNRRFSDEHLNRTIYNSKRHSRSFAVSLMDLDNFKVINDTHGHDVGDVVLQEVANLLKGFRVGSDSASRYGGEEFLLVVEDIDRENIEKRLEQLRNKIERLTLFDNNGAAFSITASFGVSIFPDDGQTAEQLVQRADDRLYSSKRDGKNKISV